MKSSARPYAIVTARSASTRLPGKMLRNVTSDKTALEIVMARAALTGFPVVVATSSEKSDDALEDIARGAGVEVFRGPLLNKIRRWERCFHRYRIDYGLLIDGDDLLFDYDIGKRAIEQLKNQRADMVVYPENVVPGLFTYAISARGIGRMAAYSGGDDSDTDVIAEFMRKADISTEPVALNPWERDRNYRLTLDYEEDLEMFRELIGKVGIDATGREVIDFLDENPDVVGINIGRQEEFLENQARFNESVRRRN